LCGRHQRQECVIVSSAIHAAGGCFVRPCWAWSWTGPSHPLGCRRIAVPARAAQSRLPRLRTVPRRRRVYPLGRFFQSPELSRKRSKARSSNRSLQGVSRFRQSPRIARGKATPDSCHHFRTVVLESSNQRSQKPSIPVEARKEFFCVNSPLCFHLIRRLRVPAHRCRARMATHPFQ